MQLFVENLRQCVTLPVLDEIVDGERDTLDGVFQVRVGDRRVVDVDGGARADQEDRKNNETILKQGLSLL